MKKLLCMFMSMVLLATTFNYADVKAENFINEDVVVIITDEDDLINFLMDGTEGRQGSIANDIVFTEPYSVDKELLVYSCTLLGNGHKITDMAISGPSSDGEPIVQSGLASFLMNCTVKDLTMYYNNYYLADRVDDELKVAFGGVAQATYFSTIENVTVEGNISIEGIYDQRKMFAFGGIVGCAGENSQFNNCTNKLSIDIKHQNSCLVGGIAGYIINCTLTNCKNYGNVSANGAAGGIVGGILQGSATISGCTNYATISTEVKGHDYTVGGIIGMASNDYIQIESCVNKGNLIGDYKGGIAGYVDDAQIKNCYVFMTNEQTYAPIIYASGRELFVQVIEDCSVFVDGQLSEIVGDTQKNTIDGGIEVNGYQINAKSGGVRAVYSVESEIANEEVVESGMIYSLDGYADESEMVIGSANSYVHNYVSTYNGVYYGQISDSESATTYIMTMKFADKTVQELTIKWKIRAYAKLADGTYVYSDVNNYTIYNIAEEIYKISGMRNQTYHNYVYENILKKVTPDYAEVTYSPMLVTA